MFIYKNLLFKSIIIIKKEMKYKKITHCRLCFSKKIKSIIDFGPICLSSTFPHKKSKYSKITPMIFGICKKCKLPQLLHNYNLKELSDIGVTNQPDVCYCEIIFKIPKNKWLKNSNLK